MLTLLRYNIIGISSLKYIFDEVFVFGEEFLYFLE